MPLRELKPLRDQPEYFDAIEDQLVILFRKYVYQPLMDELRRGHGRPVLTNSYDDLIQAIARGQIQFVNGHFEGQLTAVVSRELQKLGATWDRKKRWWSFPASQLTNDMRTAIGTSYSRFQAMANRLDARMGQILRETDPQAGGQGWVSGTERVDAVRGDAVVRGQIAEASKVEKIFESAIWSANKEFNLNVKGVAVAPEFTPEQRRRIAAEYTNNLQLYITDFIQKEVKELRERVIQRAVGGVRYEDLVKEVQSSYGVSKNKAKFLARQETKLMMVKFRQTRYQEAGVNSYRWKCVAGSPDHPVRPLHKKNDGKIFQWDTPPIVDEHGNRKNPGQDYNCRCTAVPVVRF